MNYCMRINMIHPGSSLGYRVEYLSEVKEVILDDHWLFVLFNDESTYGYNRDQVANFEIFTKSDDDDDCCC